VWLSPRDTIERIVASNPRRHVLLLAALGGMSSVLSWTIDAGSRIELVDWRMLAIIALSGSVLGVAGLYITGLIFRWCGQIMGGQASAGAMRAVLAWGNAPRVIGLAICLIALIAMKLAGGADASQSASRALQITLQVIVGALALWSLIAMMLMLGRVQRFGFWRTISSAVLAALLLVLFALLIRTFLFQPFNIPSGAMKPAFLVGDHFFVSKFRYGYTNYSLPFSPRLFSGRIFASEPHRGDVVVFRLPRDPATDYVKRVVGLPGDTIQMINGVLYINGQPAKRERIEDFVETEGGRTVSIKQWRETLPNGVSYATLDLVDNGLYDNTSVYKVPAGHYFMLGDNRDNSTDSRTGSERGGVGTVPLENLIGPAAIIFLSIDRDKGPGVTRPERFGMVVR
jgi:signal peptidase I